MYSHVVNYLHMQQFRWMYLLHARHIISRGFDSHSINSQESKELQFRINSTFKKSGVENSVIFSISFSKRYNSTVLLLKITSSKHNRHSLIKEKNEMSGNQKKKEKVGSRAYNSFHPFTTTKQKILLHLSKIVFNNFMNNGRFISIFIHEKGR